MKALEVGIDKWDVDDEYWKELVKELELEEQWKGDGDYTAWNVKKGIAISAIWRKDEETGPHSFMVATFFPIVSIEEILDMLERIMGISFGDDMDIRGCLGKTNYGHHPEEIIKLFREALEET